jgi:hypothetical protein
VRKLKVKILPIVALVIYSILGRLGLARVFAQTTIPQPITDVGTLFWLVAEFVGMLALFLVAVTAVYVFIRALQRDAVSELKSDYAVVKNLEQFTAKEDAITNVIINAFKPLQSAIEELKEDVKKLKRSS